MKGWGGLTRPREGYDRSREILQFPKNSVFNILHKFLLQSTHRCCTIFRTWQRLIFS